MPLEDDVIRELNTKILYICEQVDQLHNVLEYMKEMYSQTDGSRENKNDQAYQLVKNDNSWVKDRIKELAQLVNDMTGLKDTLPDP